MTEPHNLPSPWPKPIDVVGKNIANLASAVGNCAISGPTNTINPLRMHGQRYVGSRDWDEAQRLKRQGRVSPYRSRRLASMSLGNPENPTLISGVRYPTGRQKIGKPLYTQIQGPFGIIQRVMSLFGR